MNIREGAFLGGPSVVLALAIGMALGTGLSISGAVPQSEPSFLPPCVDLVADNHGMCEGPLLDLPACVTEDSDNCVWDARVMGNGRGESFVAYEGAVYYVEVKQ
jgi:hypothetical protein